MNRQRAKRLALEALGGAAAIDKLSRFSYQVRYRHGEVDSMRAVDLSQARLQDGLTAPVLDADWFGWYQTSFSWDESHFIYEMQPREAKLGYHFLYWRRDEAWERREPNDRSSRTFIRMSAHDHAWKSLQIFDYSFLRLTPHNYWWGRTISLGNHLTMSCIPPDKVVWQSLGTEEFANERSEIVDSVGRLQRLWIGQDTGRIRGVLTYTIKEALATEFYKSDAVKRIAGREFEKAFDYANWLHGHATADQLVEISLVWSDLRQKAQSVDITPNELVQFDDYHEIAPGVWLPFRETRTFPHAAKARGKSKIIRSELVVEDVRSDLDLARHFAELLPGENDVIQDQRDGK